MTIKRKSSEEINREIFEDNLEKHGCGYYSICREHACSCRLSRVGEFDNEEFTMLADRWHAIFDDEEDDDFIVENTGYIGDL